MAFRYPKGRAPREDTPDSAPFENVVTHRPRLLISVPDAFHALAMAAPGFVHTLEDHAHVDWLIPPWLTQSLPRQGQTLTPHPVGQGLRGKLANLTYNARLDALHHQGRLPDWPLIRRRLAWGTLQNTLVRALAQTLNHLPRLERRLRTLDRSVLPVALTPNAYDLIVLGSAGVKRLDHALANALPPSLPRYGIVHSWDNLTSKAPGFDRLDRIAVWNDHMKHHARQALGYPDDHVAVTGVPQFDVLHHFTPSRSRADRLADWGWPADTRYVLFAGITALGSPWQARYVQTLLDALETHHVLIRGHPGEGGDVFASLAGHPRVHIVRAGSGAVSQWHPLPGQSLAAAEQMADADAVIGLASTLTLEALQLNRPVINLAYDAGPPVAGVGAQAFLDTQHYRPVAQSPAVTLATSPAELVEQVRTIHHWWPQAKTHVPPLNRWVDPFGDGRASQRLAEDILQTANA